MAASGVLIARAAFNADLEVLGVLVAIGMSTMATLTWHHARTAERRYVSAAEQSRPRPDALGLLTAATLLTAAVALVVTLAL